ncbi:hypothetical protein LSH36_396g06016 [Paralvinella palmiformis]|uniref:Uncharacterized protein n=1 Tax=Paralvinella palmiformis TaxID=53620 RepID=A0AAD9JCJ5_9ANNE|nr:hypothetical protein LSH36_396g06016 [Paralvinella palmiformis]
MLLNVVLTTFILSLAVHCRYAEEINVAITCVNQLWFYADGQTIIQPNTLGGNNLAITKHVSVPPDTNVYGIKCADVGAVGGIIASMNAGTTTAGSDCVWIVSLRFSGAVPLSTFNLWNKILCCDMKRAGSQYSSNNTFLFCPPLCTNTKPDSGWLLESYDDSDWQSAHVIHTNNRPNSYWNLQIDISRKASWIWTNGWKGQDKTVYCRKAKTAHWGMWSAWNTCSGDCTTAVQTRTRLCRGNSCPGSNQQTKKCVPFVQNEDCARCKLNTANIGYLASCNHSTKFYQCQKDINGHYTLSLMSCADCTMWDQTKLTCVRDPSRNDCNHNMGSTGVKEHVTTFGSTCQRGDLHFGVISGDSIKYMMYSYGVAIEMRCPMGTRFNITECGCTYVDTTHMVQTQLKPEMCITFETMTETSKWGFSENSVWISNHGKNWDSEHVQMSFNDCIEGRKCAYFNGQSYLSVDTLANSFHTWKKFNISLWYKPGHLGTMGLLTNGLSSNGCSSLPTVCMSVRIDG